MSFQSEFIMGLADLTGELMRNAINSLATGNTEVQLLLFSYFVPKQNGVIDATDNTDVE